MELWLECIYYIGFCGRSDLCRTWPGLSRTTEKRQFLLTWWQGCSNVRLSLGSGKISLIRRWLQCLAAAHVTSHAYVFSGFKKGKEIVYSCHKLNVGIGGLGWSTITRGEQGQMAHIVMTNKWSELQTSVQVKIAANHAMQKSVCIAWFTAFSLEVNNHQCHSRQEDQREQLPSSLQLLPLEAAGSTNVGRTLSNTIWTTN